MWGHHGQSDCERLLPIGNADEVALYHGAFFAMAQRDLAVERSTMT
jgi:hypothetical protein